MEFYEDDELDLLQNALAEYVKSLRVSLDEIIDTRSDKELLSDNASKYLEEYVSTRNKYKAAKVLLDKVDNFKRISIRFEDF